MLDKASEFGVFFAWCRLYFHLIFPCYPPVSVLEYHYLLQANLYWKHVIFTFFKMVCLRSQIRNFGFSTGIQVWDTIILDLHFCFERGSELRDYLGSQGRH